MDILGVGPLELLVVLVLILIFVGPERLPHVARQIGKVYRQLHEMSRTVAAQWQEELSAAAELEGNKDLRKALSEPLQAAKADAERMLAASLTTSAPVQSGNAKPPGGGTAVSLSATVTAPDGRAADGLPTPTTPPDGMIQGQEVREAEESASLPEMAAPTPAATDASPAAPPEDVTDPVPPVTPSSDGDPEHGDQ